MTLAAVDTDEANLATRGVLMLIFALSKTPLKMVRITHKSFGINLSTPFPKEDVPRIVNFPYGILSLQTQFDFWVQLATEQLLAHDLRPLRRLFCA